MSSDTLTILTVLLAVVVIAVLAVALVLIARGLAAISGASRRCTRHFRASRPSTCARSRAPSRAINAQFDVILGALPGIARKAAIVAERRPR